MNPNYILLLNQLIELFTRHAEGKNVTADLIELQSRVRTLLAKEQEIANMFTNNQENQ